MPLSKQQLDIITGSMLGDGCIEKDSRSKYCCFTKNQSTYDKSDCDKREYLEWHVKQMQPCKSSVRPYLKKSEHSGYRLRCRTPSFFQELENKWYKPTKSKRTKIVPPDIRLTPLSLCVWFIDDGINYPAKRQAEFCTQSFTLRENEFLVRRLKEDVGIQSKVQSFRGRYNLYVGPETYKKLIDTIKPFCVWSCYQHKHDLSEYREQTYAHGEINGRSKLTQNQIESIICEYKLGKISQKELADKHGVWQSAISRIVNGKRWKHSRMSCAQN